MKKYFFFSLLAVALTFTGFANNNPTTVLNQFHKSFSQVSNVGWSVKADFVQISFVMDNEQRIAYYDFDGHLLGTCRNVDLEKLPTKVKEKLSTKYADYTVGQIIELTTLTETSYYIQASGEKGKRVFKALNNSLSVYKKL